jgi:hypothetical protein
MAAKGNRKRRSPQTCPDSASSPHPRGGPSRRNTGFQPVGPRGRLVLVARVSPRRTFYNLSSVLAFQSLSGSSPTRDAFARHARRARYPGLARPVCARQPFDTVRLTTNERNFLDAGRGDQRSWRAPRRRCWERSNEMASPETLGEATARFPPGQQVSV